MSRMEMTGENLKMIQYIGHLNADVMLEFAKDIKKGKYAGQIIYSAYTYMIDDETTYLEVFIGVI